MQFIKKTSRPDFMNIFLYFRSWTRKDIEIAGRDEDGKHI